MIKIGFENLKEGQIIWWHIETAKLIFTRKAINFVYYTVHMLERQKRIFSLSAVVKKLQAYFWLTFDFYTTVCPRSSDPVYI